MHVSAGPTMSMSLTSEGNLYTWGSNVKGILGQSNMSEVKMSNTPTEVINKYLGKVKKFYYENERKM